MLRPSLARYTSSWPGGPATDPRDLVSHGTIVSGIIGANGAVDGVSRARLRVFKVFHDAVDTYLALQREDGSWFYQGSSAPDERMFVLAIAAAALDENVPILNFSLGYQTTHSKEEAIFDGFRRQGQAVVAATGNGGRGSPPLFPAQYEGAIAVGALDRNDRAATFSSPAPFTLVIAPGVDIVGTMPTYAGAEEYEVAIVNGNLERGRPIPWSTTTGTMSGTSAAKPQVAAAAALWTARNGRNLPGLRDAMARTARKLPEMAGAARTDSHGFGCIDLPALLA